MKELKTRSTCNYCGKAFCNHMVVMADAEWSDQGAELDNSEASNNAYCNVFCLMNDLSEHVQTSHGQLLN
jgi:hypothetical protein